MLRPPFYPNSDNNHCLQCTIRMAHNFISEEKISEDVVDQETEYNPELWTWTVAGARFLSKRFSGVQLVTAQSFDYQQFFEKGEEYLKTAWANGRLEQQRHHASSGFEKERRIAKEFLQAGTVELVQFTESLIETRLINSLLIPQVSYHALYEQPGAEGHFVLLYKAGINVFEFHDPGLPGRPHQTVSKKKFLNSFHGELIAVPRPAWLTQDLAEPSRNDPCPCGKGKKYKKCHGVPA